MKTLTNHEMNMALWAHLGFTDIRPGEPEDNHRPGRGWTGIPAGRKEDDREELFDFAAGEPGTRDRLSIVREDFTDEQKLEYVKWLYLCANGGYLTDDEMKATQHFISWWEMFAMTNAAAVIQVKAILRVVKPEIFK